MHLHMKGTEVSIKTSLRRCVLSFPRLKLKAYPKIVSLDGFELKSPFQSDNSQIMQFPP